MLRDVPLVAGPTQEQVAQEVALVLVLDGGDRLLAGHQQRRDRGRPLERVHVVGGDRLLGPQADQAGQVGAAGGDPQALHLPRADRDALADPLHPQPAGRVDQVVGGEPLTHGLGHRGRELAAVGRGEQHPDVQDPGDLLGDPVEVAALQHDLGQAGVQGIHAGQRGAGSPVTAAYQHLHSS